VTIKDDFRTRPIAWEEDAPAEPRSRRVPQGASPTGHALPGMPLDFGPDDSDDLSPRGPNRLGKRRGPWWRPWSTVGRVLLGIGILCVVAGSAVSVHLLKSYLVRDGRFRIASSGNIQATGLSQVTRAEMLPVFGEDIGRNIFFIPLSDRRKQLEEIPWVERAAVMRLLPDQIRVQVVERRPVAFARQGQQFGLVDANGVLLSMPAAQMSQRHYSFPTLSGIDAGDPVASRKTRVAVYQRLLAELDSGGQRLSAQLSEIDLTDPEDARVTMQDDTTLLHFGQDRFLERYQRYKAHIAEWRLQYPKLTAVDLRYEQQVVLEMARGSNVSEAMATDQQAANAANDAKQNKPAAGVSAAGLPTAKPKSSPARPSSKAAGHAPAKAKSASNADRVKSQRKKHAAEAKRAALHANQRKTAPTAHPASAAAQGQ